MKPLHTLTLGSICDWLRLNLALYRDTGETVYLETAERALFNEFGMNQLASGDFGHGVLTEQGTPDEMTVPAWWCCTLHGLRAFADVHENAFRNNGQEITYVLPVDGAISSTGLCGADRSAAVGVCSCGVSRSAGYHRAAYGCGANFRRPTRWETTFVAVDERGPVISS